MTQAIDGIATDNRIANLAATTQGRGEATRLRPHAPTPATAQIIALPDLHAAADGDTTDREADASVLKDWHPLHQIKARLQVCVGEATLSVGELLAAKANQVLRLDRAVDQAVDLSIEGRVVARGQLVAVDGHFAVRITELPVALGLAPGG